MIHPSFISKYNIAAYIKFTFSRYGFFLTSHISIEASDLKKKEETSMLTNYTIT